MDDELQSKLNKISDQGVEIGQMEARLAIANWLLSLSQDGTGGIRLTYADMAQKVLSMPIP